MANYVIGQDVIIRLWPDLGDVLIAGCNTTSNLQINSEFVELTPIDGRWLEVLPTYKGGSASFDSVIFFSLIGDPNTDTNQHVDWMLNQTLLNFRFTWQDGPTISGVEGRCYLQSISITAGANSFATGQIQLQITGEITLYAGS